MSAARRVEDILPQLSDALFVDLAVKVDVCDVRPEKLMIRQRFPKDTVFSGFSLSSKSGGCWMVLSSSFRKRIFAVFAVHDAPTIRPLR